MYRYSLMDNLEFKTFICIVASFGTNTVYLQVCVWSLVDTPYYILLPLEVPGETYRYTLCELCTLEPHIHEQQQQQQQHQLLRSLYLLLLPSALYPVLHEILNHSYNLYFSHPIHHWFDAAQCRLHYYCERSCNRERVS